MWLRDLKETFFVPNDKKVYNQRPLSINWTGTVNGVINIKFKFIVNVTYIYYRYATAAGSSIYVYGDEYGGRNIANELNAVNYQSSGVISGTPTINSIINAVNLDTANNLHMFQLAPWRTQNLYVQSSHAGVQVLNVAYI